MFKGTFTALVTPFKGGQVDFDSLEGLIDDQLQGGIQGLVVCGTTAESPTLTEREKLQILDVACMKASGKVPIIFGSGSNNTTEAIEFASFAKQVGADASFAVAEV